MTDHEMTDHEMIDHGMIDRETIIQDVMFGVIRVLKSVLKEQYGGGTPPLSAHYEGLKEDITQPIHFNYLVSIGLMDTLDHHDLYHLLSSARDDGDAFMRIWNSIKPEDRVESLIYEYDVCDQAIDDCQMSHKVFISWSKSCENIPDDHPSIRAIFSTPQVARSCFLTAIKHRHWPAMFTILRRAPGLWMDMDFVHAHINQVLDLWRPCDFSRADLERLEKNIADFQERRGRAISFILVHAQYSPSDQCPLALVADDRYIISKIAHMAT
jgi:hypothetical protein